MTDRELLELAAKAAGYEVESSETEGSHIHEGAGPQSWSPWNPLTNDGDALRLAVKLGMDLLADDKNIEVDAIQHSKLIDGVMVAPWAWERLGNDPYAATRRAIVRAAAEIGKGMK